MKKWIPQAVTAAFLLGLSAFLLKGNVWIFWTWWLLALVMGAAAMPVTGRLFAGFDDKGWIFSKVLAIAVSGFITWFLVAVEVMPFNSAACIGVSLVCAAVCFVLFHRQTKKGIECFPVDHGLLIFWEEVLFFGAFLLWTYLAGFRPQISYNTEKFMDFGFMEAMLRSSVLPPKDIWYSQGNLNYYYGGQYFAVFLTRLSGSTAEMTYNLMRSFVAGFAFAMPFSLVYQMLRDRFYWHISKKKAWVPGAAGVVSGVAVSIAGNMHYVVYCKILPWIAKLRGETYEDGYWFPDATRYIGFNPDVPDKTIHEFPCYSFVLGDLHAHVVNIMFVLLLLGILYAWMKWVRKYKTEEPLMGKDFWIRNLLMPHILLVSVLLGMFKWTNFWDFVIYFVVTGGVVVFMNVVRFKGNTRAIFAATAVQALEVILISYVVILPFTLKFETMVSGVALAQYHSLPHQLLVLWGLPSILFLVFFARLLWEKLYIGKKRGLYRLMQSVGTADLFAVIMGLCALGLVMIPELVYVRDIYENGNARANTMFKLTYQAYMMFGMTMAYVIFRMMFINRQKILKGIAGIGLVCLLATVGYFGNSVHAWFGEVWDPAQYKSINAAWFLERDFPEDAAGIRWLKAKVKGTPVVLEANGDSYSSYNRVSAMTGLPTVLGWYVHEWLWRSNVEDLNAKSYDVESIYTSADYGFVEELLEKYDVSYIFVGSKEREKYGDRLNEELLGAMGEVVFEDEEFDTYIIKVY